MANSAAFDLGPTVAEVLQALGETTADDALRRRVEEASLNAWPALQQMLLDGWVLRFSKGFTRRANSVTPVYPSTQPIPDKVRYCENLYAREGLPTYFRLTTLRDADGLDEVLAVRGYAQQGAARVLHRTLAGLRPSKNPPSSDGQRMQPDCEPKPRSRKLAGTLASGPGFALAPLGSFLATYTELTGLKGHLENSGLDGQAAAALHGSVLRAIRGETVFGLLVDDGRPVACGMAVVEGELAGLFDIVTHPDSRRRGYGRLLVQSLLAHAAAMGASHAYLQVLADNAPALALYDGLGFSTLYEYWYRVPRQPERS